MKQITPYHIAWIVVGCILAEAVFLIVQIILTVLASQEHYALQQMLSPNNPFYALPPYFIVIGIMFLVIALYGGFKHIRSSGYYASASLLVAIIYHIILSNPNYPFFSKALIIDLVAACISGLAYWAICPRRMY